MSLQKKVTFGSDPAPYSQPKSKCDLNDSQWLETHLNMFLESITKTDLHSFLEGLPTDLQLSFFIIVGSR